MRVFELAESRSRRNGKVLLGIEILPDDPIKKIAEGIAEFRVEFLDQFLRRI